MFLGSGVTAPEDVLLLDWSEVGPCAEPIADLAQTVISDVKPEVFKCVKHLNTSLSVCIHPNYCSPLSSSSRPLLTGQLLALLCVLIGTR